MRKISNLLELLINFIENLYKRMSSDYDSLCKTFTKYVE